jgi:para-aminobenzoate synthetase component I
MTATVATAVTAAERLAHGRRLCFLDSAAGGGWSHVLADPAAFFRSKDGRLDLCPLSDAAPELPGSPGADPFLALRDLLRRRPDLIAAGYWAYDLRYHLERLPAIARDDLCQPDCWVGLYPRTGVRAFPAAESPPARPQVGDAGPALPADLKSARGPFEAAVRRVQEYIAAGDCYQVNLSHRITLPLLEDPWTLYRRLRLASPTPYAAYLDCGDHQVLSASPELFLRVRNGLVETRPIKGTRPRGATPGQDASLARELASSQKDRAELLMIVDLERNDLGRVCDYGSVEVPELFALERYSNVHHLVATVRGRLRPELGALDCLRAAFPGGSITGAPKIRAMEIIEELEPVRRGVYTGAIGWCDGRGNGEWNIAIRTMLTRDGQVHFHVGSGIVADSNPAAEFEETLAKAAGMLAAIAPETEPSHDRALP